MKVALVHDFIKEYGGAERVLRVLSDLYPKAPIFTAFRVKGSTADGQFRDRKIIESKFAPLLKRWRLYSPLRFLIPWIWGSIDLSKYDLMITSSSWYITRGFKVSPKAKVICYCHTPPRWLYGYRLSVGFSKYWPVKVYAAIVGHFIRIYDFNCAQKIKHWIANSENVKERIEKFYRKQAKVIYPPVEVEKIIKETEKGGKKENYFLVASRLVGAKGLEETIKAFSKKEMAKYKLKVVGESHGFYDVERKIKEKASANIQFLDYIPDNQLYSLYTKAKGFLALAKDEDFGMTVVEAQAAGTPVIAFEGGGFKESVIEGKTGIFIQKTNSKTILKAIKKLEKKKWNKEILQRNAKRFSREKFVFKFKQYLKAVRE